MNQRSGADKKENMCKGFEARSEKIEHCEGEISKDWLLTDSSNSCLSPRKDFLSNPYIVIVNCGCAIALTKKLHLLASSDTNHRCRNTVQGEAKSIIPPRTQKG